MKTSRVIRSSVPIEIRRTYDAIKWAIEEKKPVSATYDGLKREMCPHVLGFKNGNPQALFYQFGGESRSGLQPDGSPANWRCVTLAKLSDVNVIDGTWHTGTNHSRPQTCVDEIEVEVEVAI